MPAPAGDLRSGRYRIGREYRFAAGHHLPTLPERHKCARPHGVARTVLADLGYHSSSPQATTLTRHIDDILVPRITIDLTQPMHHVPGEDGVREVLSRRTWQPLPGHDQPLPVLAAPDALLHLDPAPLVPAAAGWARLRRIWPQLPPAPLSTHGGDTDVDPVAGGKR